MNKPETVVYYYYQVLQIRHNVCPILLYDWQLSRFVYTSVTTNT